jgi:putative transposase
MTLAAEAICMVASAYESFFRLVIAPGEIVLRYTRLVRIEARLSKSLARVRDLATGLEEDVALSELRGRAVLTDAVRADQHLETFRISSGEAELVATGREEILAELICGLGEWSSRVYTLTIKYGISRSTIYRWLSRYRDVAAPSSLIPLPRGIAPGTKRLDDAREQLVNKVIEERYLTRSRANAEEICRIVHRRCVEGGLKPVSRNAVRARINRLDLKLVAQARHGRKSAQNLYAQRPGHFPVDRILQSVQIDHALADVIVVDERDRLSIGRPWLTLAVDVFSRCVLGFYVSLDCPAVTSIGLCLTQACLPKQPWLRARDLDLEWPMCGLPSVLRADNGKDFRSDALRRGCREHGIDLDFRPIATPHFGGHIERLIGSVMGRIHLLPGTTFSSPRERKDYPSEEKAAMTLAEFEHWLAVEVSERYHRDQHRGLGATPLSVWEHGVNAGVEQTLPADPRRFRLSFLPIEYRTLQRGGVQLNRIHYWSDVLPTLVKRDEPLVVHYDPRDLSRIYVKAPDHSYVDVPYADIRLPPISLWELRAARRFLAQRGESHRNQARLFWAHDELTRIAAEAVTETRRVRRQRERRHTLAREQALESLPKTQTSSTIDYNKVPEDLPTETWAPRRRP